MDPPATPTRAEANALFVAGDLPAAAAAYSSVLADDGTAEDDRLAVLSNLGLVHFKLGDCAAALAALREGLGMSPACHRNAGLAVKIAARLMSTCDALGDGAGTRAALADCRFFLALPGAGIVKNLELPAGPDASAVTKLLMTIGCSESDDDGLDDVREALCLAPAEAGDAHGMNAVCLSVHIACLRQEKPWGVSLVEMMLAGGTPVDARSEKEGRTALALAANNGRPDLVSLFLEAGAR